MPFFILRGIGPSATAATAAGPSPEAVPPARNLAGQVGQGAADAGAATIHHVAAAPPARRPPRASRCRRLEGRGPHGRAPPAAAAAGPAGRKGGSARRGGGLRNLRSTAGVIQAALTRGRMEHGERRGGAGRLAEERGWGVRAAGGQGSRLTARLVARLLAAAGRSRPKRSVFIWGDGDGQDGGLVAAGLVDQGEEGGGHVRVQPLGHGLTQAKRAGVQGRVVLQGL